MYEFTDEVFGGVSWNGNEKYVSTAVHPQLIL